MSFDLVLFANKLMKFFDLYPSKVDNFSDGTGISLDRLQELKSAKSSPSGDEILTLADYFKCDYNYFLSAEENSIIDTVDLLFRKYNTSFTLEDKWIIQEFLFLCECQFFLRNELHYETLPHFEYQSTDNDYRNQGKEAAAQLLKFLGYRENALKINIFEDLRKLGYHIFRRKLKQNTISGVYIYHKIIGHCILVNYDDDIYRQRFTVAHEVGHAILDGSQFNISTITNKGKRSDDQLAESRANSFAGAFLVPETFLKKIPDANTWNNDKIIDYSKKMAVNPITLAIGLFESKLISEEDKEKYANIKLKKDEKVDSELSNSLSEKDKKRYRFLLDKGLSKDYVELCFKAYRSNIISQGRLSEILLCNTHAELVEFSGFFNESLNYDN
ncbi:MAG: ImmA/IrrE family metallo-endopeptidase [Lactobacillales bacterium]|jgi:Zn-dependent peptidase ImmA (M78 family)|nr:ImmA/IrrE family metallo-endopeptidase [Lactobacillales bacterium]